MRSRLPHADGNALTFLAARADTGVEAHVVADEILRTKSALTTADGEARLLQATVGQKEESANRRGRVRACARATRSDPHVLPPLNSSARRLQDDAQRSERATGGGGLKDGQAQDSRQARDAQAGSDGHSPREPADHRDRLVSAPQPTALPVLLNAASGTDAVVWS